MRNNMKELNKKYAYDLKDLSYSQLETLAHKFDTELIASNQIKGGTFKWMNDSRKGMLLFLYDHVYKSWVFRDFYKKELTINALTLFDNEVWKPKQGDKVLYTDDLVNWEEAIFLVKHDESYIVESDEMLLYAIEIKPYEDEIKVGDWVKRINDETIWKIRNKDDINVALNSEFTKITNPELIELLNKEL